MSTRPSSRIFLTRAAQSVLHRTIGDRTHADALGQSIAEYAIENWDNLQTTYAHHCDDDLEMVTCLARDLLAAHPEWAQ